MWIYGDDDTEAINLQHVATIRIHSEGDKVIVIATPTDGEEMVIKTCNSGAEARDWLKHLLASVNERG